MQALDFSCLVVIEVCDGTALVADESESFNIRTEALYEEVPDDSFESYQEWVAGAIIR